MAGDMSWSKVYFAFQLMLPEYKFRDAQVSLDINYCSATAAKAGSQEFCDWGRNKVWEKLEKRSQSSSDIHGTSLGAPEVRPILYNCW